MRLAGGLRRCVGIGWGWVPRKGSGKGAPCGGPCTELCPVSAPSAGSGSSPPCSMPRAASDLSAPKTQEHIPGHGVARPARTQPGPGRAGVQKHQGCPTQLEARERGVMGHGAHGSWVRSRSWGPTLACPLLTPDRAEPCPPPACPVGSSLPFYPILYIPEQRPPYWPRPPCPGGAAGQGTGWARPWGAARPRLPQHLPPQGSRTSCVCRVPGARAMRSLLSPLSSFSNWFEYFA